MQKILNRKSVVVIGMVTVLICLFALTYLAESASVPSEILSPVVGDLEIVSSLEQCTDTKWCFNQYKSGGHVPGGGICQADDTYAWDANLNIPEHDTDNGKPVYAVEQGVVAQSFGDCINAGGSYGQLLIEHKYQGNTWWSGYLHLRDIQVEPSQSVDKDTLLGYISNTSPDQIPNHLHFVVYKGQNSRGNLVSFDANIVERSSSPKFQSGDSVKTTENLHMRTEPKINDNVITTIPSGSTGRVVDDEDNGIFASGYNWWHVQFGDNNGWCVEDWLEKVEPSTTQSVFTVVGTVRKADGSLAEDGLEVVGSNETREGITVTTTLGEQESGKYGVSFVSTENKKVASEGDTIKFTVKSEGDVLGTSTYNLTSEDIAKALALVDVTLGLPTNQPPVAEFTYSPESPDVDDEITFDTSASSDSDGEIVSYEWDFGDGNTDSGEKVTHSYDTPYTYIITLTVTDDRGDKAEKTIGLPVPSIGGGSFIMSYFGPPTLEIANLDKDDREQVHNVIKQVLNIGKAKSKLIGEQDEALLNELNLLVNQLNPAQQDKELEAEDVVKENALSEEQELLISLVGGIGGAGITFLTGLPVAPLTIVLEELGKKIGLELGEKLVLRDMGSATVSYPGVGRMEIVWLRPPKDKIIVNMYLEKSAKRGCIFLSVGEWRNKLKLDWGVNANSTVPVWNAFAYPPENPLAGPESIIDHVQIISLHSPSELRVYDSQGRVSGLVNGEVREEIPGSVYDEERKETIISNPSDSYRYEIVGTEEGTYGLEVNSVEGGESTTFTATDIPTSSNAVHQYSVDWDALKEDKEEAVTVKTDSDGDGTFEETVNTGKTYTPVEERPSWDVNSDGKVNIFDLVLVGKNFGGTGGEVAGDVNDDKQVNIFDLVLVGKHFGEKAAPAKNNVDLFQQIYDILKTAPNPNDNLKLALKELEKLLTPKETVLMQNYPNPFNPETWIPFQLSDDAKVIVSIYDVEGQLVRKIGLGKVSAGMYMDKDRAVYWDGCNKSGEKVSSGLYFYQLQAGDYSATRRMLILK